VFSFYRDCRKGVKSVESRGSYFRNKETNGNEVKGFFYLKNGSRPGRGRGKTDEGGNVLANNVSKNNEGYAARGFFRIGHSWKGRIGQ